MFVVALEDSVILQLDFEKEQELKKLNHKFETIFRIMAEERYTELLEKYPLLAQRIPQYALASYLGMTTEFLSKIRNNKIKKKS